VTQETRVRVRYAETDQMGVVYHANYLVWLEAGRVEFCRAAGLRYRDLEAEGVLLAVIEVQCRFVAPARYDDEIIVRTWITAASRRGVRFEYEVLDAETGRRLATAATHHLFCGKDLRPLKLPEKYAGVFGLRPQSTERGSVK
jgi:acyl-CoA thioester hydrolase